MKTPPRTGLRRHWYVWSWRARYFWHDTRGGFYAQLSLAVLLGLLSLAMMIDKARNPLPPDAPVQAIVWWVQLIIMVVVALISYALAPKPKAPEKQQLKVSTVEDGTYLKRHYGTCWVDDSFIAAAKQMGESAIRKKSK